MNRPTLKYFFGFASWAAVGLFGASYMGLISLGADVFSVVLGALVVMCLAGAWFVELIDRRLSLLARAAEDFAAGVQRVQLDVSKNDEIGALTEAFNQMAEATDRRIAKLQDSLQQQRLIAEQGPDAMFVFDVGEFRLVDVNQNFVDLSGYPRDQLIGRTPMDLSPEIQEGRPTENYARILIERILQGERLSARWILRNKSGEDIPCELRAVHLPSPDRTLISGSLMDIRSRLRTENELAQRLRFENLIMMLSSATTALTAESIDGGIQQALADIGQFAQVDRSYLFLFDDEARTVTCTHEWCAPEVQPQIARLRNLSVTQFAWVEGRLQHGEIVHVPRVADLPEEAAAERREWQAESIQSILLVPVTALGRVRGYVGFDAVRAEKVWPTEYQDVLRLFGEIVINAIIRVQAEVALRQKNETLATTVQELERSNEELQQFAYISSHDLQEPLRSIGGFSELLRRHYAEALDARGQSYVEFINTAAKRLHHLIVGLLDYSRVDARARPFEACAMDNVMGLALDNLAASVQDSAARVTRDALPVVPGDASQLTVLLQNLIGNALKFHGDEPPRVHVGVRPARAPDSGWEFSVRDNGIGIAPSDARKLFQIFRRLNAADKYPGTGIGLAVCKRIVTRHNGRIWVESNPEGGCSFCFTLPALAESAVAA
jgi:PAS domain S-box-containing protein